MIAYLKLYVVCKDFGLPWLGLVPGHWAICRVKFLLREINLFSTTWKDIAHSDCGINLQCGYRTHLVTEVVTGQFDMREAAI